MKRVSSQITLNVFRIQVPKNDYASKELIHFFLDSGSHFIHAILLFDC